MSLPPRPLLIRRTTNRPDDTAATAPLLSDVGGDPGRALNLDANLSSGFDLISDFDLSGAARDEEFLDELSFNDMLQQNNEEM